MGKKLSIIRPTLTVNENSVFFYVRWYYITLYLSLAKTLSGTVPAGMHTLEVYNSLD